MWDLERREPARFRHRGLTATAPSPDGKLLAIGYENGRLLLWGAHWTRPKRLTGHRAAISDLAFSRDGARLFSLSRAEATVRTWDVGKRRCEQAIQQTETRGRSRSEKPEDLAIHAWLNLAYRPGRGGYSDQRDPAPRRHLPFREPHPHETIRLHFATACGDLRQGRKALPPLV